MAHTTAWRRRLIGLCGVLIVVTGSAFVVHSLRNSGSTVVRRVGSLATAKHQEGTPEPARSQKPGDARTICLERAGVNTVECTDASSSGPDNLDSREHCSNVSEDIRLLLAEHCLRCHGPSRQAAGIRFDQRETVFRPAASGALPVVAGDAANSELLARVITSDPSVRMPQDSPPLSQGEIRRLTEWISAGADWPADARHWAFVPPKSDLPPDPLQSQWSRNAIDGFIAARRESAGLAPAAEADRATLIRRLSLDLIGLPPTPEDVDAFIADDQPDAVERLTDRLLASPHFGEKWAIRWLDLSRYADTNGFEFDSPRTIWQYRDWLINALNTDMPFDQFTVEQLAGDRLPDATDAQRVATGFLRNSPVAADTATHRFEMLVDRVNTLGSVWLGLTVQCAQCHDHKFDPMTQRDYYRLFAILNNSIDEVAGTQYAGRTINAISPLNGQVAPTLVMKDRRDPNVTHLKVRGSPVHDGEQVQPGLPDFLHAPRCREGDRLSLACWLIDDDNSLTPRVAVNRIWEQVFGAGLVRTSDDFGLRGEPPSHPKLLDWLAVEYRRVDWSSKQIIRKLVSSATYRQSSTHSAESLECDPMNRLLAHAPRFRVDAELLRDIALSASGLLSETMGGPSVFPWQPPGTSENVEFASFVWPVSSDESCYRRGLYTFWKRRTLYPSFALFDAPSRAATCTRRNRTTNPLQALVCLNDPVYVEAAVHLGGRMLDETDGSPKAAIRRGFRLCVARSPQQEEVSVLMDLHRQELQRLLGDINSAVAYLGERALEKYPGRDTVQWATNAVVASVLLGLDETITRE